MIAVAARAWVLFTAETPGAAIVVIGLREMIDDARARRIDAPPLGVEHPRADEDLIELIPALVIEGATVGRRPIAEEIDETQGADGRQRLRRIHGRVQSLED